VYSIFQLRLHPSIINLKKELESKPDRQKVEINLKYVTRRGPWYHVSWKGDDEKSGGLALNIGIHFFDALIWIFGKVISSEVRMSTPKQVAGILQLEWADVDWFLSIDLNDLPEHRRKAGKTAFRSITMEGEELEFTDGFDDLHTVSYREILAGRGFGIQDARAGLELVHSFNTIE
jgi:UDP-N-acetyl-2-amino-2-deoxyglucuronate dehydrogenase